MSGHSQPTVNAEEPVRCIQCGSTQVHAEKRGWTLGKGLFGSSQIMITCLKCGTRFKPGEQARGPASTIPRMSTAARFGWIALLAFLVYAFIQLMSQQ